MAAYQYIYVMKRLTQDLSRAGKKVLENITLSFLPGAKIGVLGVNGAGKSTLLRIMAGARPRVRRRGLGGRRRHASASCRRSRSSIPTKDVLGNVEEGVAATKALLDRFDEVSAQASPSR